MPLCHPSGSSAGLPYSARLYVHSACALGASARRVITIVVGFPAGGATDVTTRLFAEKLSEKFGQRVIVENRVGANGLIGTLAVANAAPDGYTLVMGGVNTHGCTTPSSRARVTTR